jgi:LysR family transcriptional regulator, low CO2-responsive transcriptional regulator
MVQPSLTELKAFDATARARSMSAAARALGLRQPTVSAHIASLEASLGVELFFRRGNRLELTEFGRTLSGITNRIFRAEEDAQALIASVRSRYTGHLRIWAVGPYNVVPMLKSFLRRWPNVNVAVGVGDSKQIVEQILDYRGDIGVLVHSVTDPRIHCVPFRRQRLLVFANREHPLGHRASICLEDLEQQLFVMREEGSTTRRVFERSLQEAGVKVRVSLEMGSREAVREAVAHGLGLGVVADTAYVPDPRLVKLPIDGPDMFTHSHVICLAERQTVPLLAGFFSIVDELRQGPGAV